MISVQILLLVSCLAVTVDNIGMFCCIKRMQDPVNYIKSGKGCKDNKDASDLLKKDLQRVQDLSDYAKQQGEKIYEYYSGGDYNSDDKISHFVNELKDVVYESVKDTVPLSLNFKQPDNTATIRSVLLCGGKLASPESAQAHYMANKGQHARKCVGYKDYLNGVPSIDYVRSNYINEVGFSLKVHIGKHKYVDPVEEGSFGRDDYSISKSFASDAGGPAREFIGELFVWGESSWCFNVERDENMVKYNRGNERYFWTTDKDKKDFVIKELICFLILQSIYVDNLLPWGWPLYFFRIFGNAKDGFWEDSNIGDFISLQEFVDEVKFLCSSKEKIEDVEDVSSKDYRLLKDLITKFANAKISNVDIRLLQYIVAQYADKDRRMGVYFDPYECDNVEDLFFYVFKRWISRDFLKEMYMLKKSLQEKAGACVEWLDSGDHDVSYLEKKFVSPVPLPSDVVKRIKEDMKDTHFTDGQVMMNECFYKAIENNAECIKNKEGLSLEQKEAMLKKYGAVLCTYFFGTASLPGGKIRLNSCRKYGYNCGRQLEDVFLSIRTCFLEINLCYSGDGLPPGEKILESFSKSLSLELLLAEGGRFNKA